ncbi:hypothetical protein CC78DRAFT_536075 [Lojkania enalia]|uniref:LysM domain-containing protein n=1 Tax=Lojkania enalia TaxID=147567 RepID=A0A9P4K1J2_9PLEO|nr:hypothetical protein CC78DRAFT_536075 [Didymosphaeria enalia]
MGRWVDRESDEERLPEGFKRVGYDADTQQYTYQDASGQYFSGEPGSRYGLLRPSGYQPSPEEIEQHNASLKRSNRESVRLMLPFVLLVLVVMILLFKFINTGSSTDHKEQVHCAEHAEPITIKDGQTCWEIGEKYGVGVDELLGIEGNEEVDCDKLQVGQTICVPV